MSTATNYLLPHGPAATKRLPDNRDQIIRKWDVPSVEYARASEYEKYLFQPWGTPDGVMTGVDAKFTSATLPKDVYPNTLLVDQYFAEKKDGLESDSIVVLVKVYESLTPGVLTPAGRATTVTNKSGLLEHTEYFIAPLDYDTSLFEEVGSAKASTFRSKQLYLGSLTDEDNHYAKQVAKVWVEQGILQVTTPKIGGQQTVNVSTIGLTEANVFAAITEVTANHKLVGVTLGDYEGLQSKDFTFEVDTFEIWSETENGLNQIELTQLSVTAFVRGDVGTSPYDSLILSGETIDNGNTIKKRVSQWSEPGILSVNTPLVGGQQTVEVQAIGLTEAQVGTLLSEVTASHVLISQSKSDYNGLNTIRYTFEVDDFDVVEYTETNLKMVTRTELSETSFAEVTIGTDTYLTTPTLYAGTQTIDNGNTIKKRVTKWLEAGKLFERESNPDDGLKRVTTGWWHAVGTTVGPIISKDTQNYLGFNVITIETMTAPDGTDITDGDDDKKVADFETLANWTRPGVVAISEKRKNGTSAATKVNVWQQPPCQMKVRAHVEIYFSKSEEISDSVFDSITGGTDIKLWNPEGWATLDGSGANDHNVDEINRTYRGFRVVDSTDAIYSATYPKYGTSAEAIQGRNLLLYYNAGWFGKWFETGSPEGTVIGEASLSGGPEKPEGKIWMLDVQNPKAFTDVDGVDYYKKTYVWTYIPDFEAGEDIWDDAP